MATYDLGRLVGNTWHQHADSSGQDYYVNVSNGQKQYNIPTGWEDSPNDTWAIDTSRNWPQWRNTRTGRITRSDPNPPAPQTYLDLNNVATHMSLVEAVPDSREPLYRRPMGGILRWLFPERNGFDVVQEDLADDGNPDFTVFKILARPGGSQYAYTFAVVEAKSPAKPWGATEDQCREYCQNSGNDSGQVYGIVQIGLEVRFYKYNKGDFRALSGKMHLRHDVHLVTQWADHLKNNPIPYV